MSECIYCGMYPAQTNQAIRSLARSCHSANAIIAELYKAFERLDAPPDLLAIVGSYGDTLSDDEVLRLLREYNRTGKVLHERQ